MDNNFLLKEYELCFEHLRYYDSRNTQILEFIFGFTSATATLQFAMYKFLSGTIADLFIFQTFLSGVTATASLLFYFAMLRNRIYIIHFVRQINSIRRYMLSTGSIGFNNRLYTNPNVKVFSLTSFNTTQLIGVALASAFFFGIFCYCLASIFLNVIYACYIVIASALFLIILLTIGYKYLSNSNNSSIETSLDVK